MALTAAKISDTQPKIVRLKLNVSSVEKATHTKDARIEEKTAKCANCKGKHVANYKGCASYKKQVFRQHVVVNQRSYAPILKENSAPPPQPSGDTFSFSADQLIRFVATMAIQIAQLQVSYSNAPKRRS